MTLYIIYARAGTSMLSETSEGLSPIHGTNGLKNPCLQTIGTTLSMKLVVAGVDKYVKLIISIAKV